MTRGGLARGWKIVVCGCLPPSEAWAAAIELGLPAGVVEGSTDVNAQVPFVDRLSSHGNHRSVAVLERVGYRFVADMGAHDRYRVDLNTWNEVGDEAP